MAHPVEAAHAQQGAVGSAAKWHTPLSSVHERSEQSRAVQVAEVGVAGVQGWSEGCNCAGGDGGSEGGVKDRQRW